MEVEVKITITVDVPDTTALEGDIVNQLELITDIISKRIQRDLDPETFTEWTDDKTLKGHIYLDEVGSNGVWSVTPTKENRSRKKGWGFPAAARKAHYFNDDLVSVCGRWMYGGTLYDKPHTELKADCCTECIKKAIKLNVR